MNDGSLNAVGATPLRDVDLYWLPLGGGGRAVRPNGLVFEALSSRR
jgi:hypothetical protein